MWEEVLEVWEEKIRTQVWENRIVNGLGKYTAISGYK